MNELLNESMRNFEMSMLPPEAPSEDCLRQSSASLYPNLAHEFGSDQIIGGEDSPKHATDAVEQSSRLKMPVSNKSFLHNIMRVYTRYQTFTSLATPVVEYAL